MKADSSSAVIAATSSDLSRILESPWCAVAKKMAQLVPNIVEASQEKHLPAVTVSGDTVKVFIGSALIP